MMTTAARTSARATLDRTLFAILAALSALAVWLAASSVRAETPELGYKMMTVEGTYDDVVFELKNAVVNRGLVIDYTGHLQTMLERTGDAVGSTTEGGAKSPYLNANYYHFCSAKLTHGVVSANPLNIAICPYIMFTYELRAKPGTIHVGYRRPIGDPSRISRQAIAKVEDLLAEIVKEATGG